MTPRPTLPPHAFHAIPVNPDLGKDETMNFDPTKGTLGSLLKTFNFNYTSGSINA